MIQGFAQSSGKYQRPSPPGVVFRAREPFDTPDLFGLFNDPTFLENASTHGRFECPQEFDNWLNGIAPCGKFEVVAEVDTRVVAFGGLYTLPELMNHSGSLMLGVREENQKQGIGSTILRILLMTADIMAGLSKIQLTVFEHNSDAVRLYRDFGFEVEGLLKRFSRRGDGFTNAYSMALFFDQLDRARQAA